MLYRPRLANGKLVPLAWPVALYRLTNIICWPLEDNVSRRAYLLDRFLWAFGFFVFTYSNDAELRYLRVNRNDLDVMLEGLPSCLAVNEIYIRGFTLGLQKEKFKRLLQKFYAEIYIEKSMHPELFQMIQRKNLLILIFSFFYLCTINTYIFSPAHRILTGSRELLFKMEPIFDYQALYVYLPLFLSTFWGGVIVASMIFGEANILLLQIFHLNGRYILMRENFIKKVDKLLESNRDDDNIVKKYRELLLSVIKENIRLNTFAQEVQEEFSFRIFLIFLFAAVELCGMLFKVYTSPRTSLVFIFWAVAKTMEILAYGEMGSTIINTTDSIGSTYYESKWESIIERSSDTKANIQLMKLINLAIVVNRKPFSLTGLNFFQVSLATSVTILRGAGSYFTCLIALR